MPATENTNNRVMSQQPASIDAAAKSITAIPTNLATLSTKLTMQKNESSHNKKKNTLNNSSSHTATIAKLNASEERLNELQVKHREELYWLQLELQTTRREKEAVEDRMAELYRDVQDLVALSASHEQQQVADSSNENSAPDNNTVNAGQGTVFCTRSTLHVVPLTVDHVMNLQNQLEKREKMIRIMNNQIALVRSSGDNVIKTLKEEISDLMDEKSRVEVNLMNQLTNLDREKRELQIKLEVAEQHQEHPSSKGNSGRLSRSLHQKSTLSINGSSSSQDTNISLVHSAASFTKPRSQFQLASARVPATKDPTSLELEHLRADVAVSHTELSNCTKALREEVQKVEKLKETNSELMVQIETLQKELVVVRSSTEVVQVMDRVQSNRSETLQTLDRVVLLWDRADQSIQSLDAIMQELKPREESLDQDRDRMLSTLETACLVHGQVKVALVLIELKLRNNLACFQNDKTQFDLTRASAALPLFPRSGTSARQVLGDKINSHPLVSQCSDQAFRYDDQLEIIQNETKAAIEQIQETLNDQMMKLEVQAAHETEIVKLTLESRVDDLQRMQSRQTLLEQELSRFHKNDVQSAKGDAHNDGEEDFFVSREVLEQLQNEVLQVVQRLQEKNELVGRLTATVEEHKVRERALMDELRRLLSEQARTQEIERQQRMETQKRLAAMNGNGEESEGEDDDVVGELGEDGSFVCEEDEYEEEMVSIEETVYD